MTNLLDYRCVGSKSVLPIAVNAIEINCDGSFVAVADAEKKLTIFGLDDLISGAAASITVDCSAEIHSLTWSGSNARIFCGLSNGTLAVVTITQVGASRYRQSHPSKHHIDQNQLIVTGFKVQREKVTSVALYADYPGQSELLATTGDGKIHLWNYSTIGEIPCLLYFLLSLHS